MGENKKIKNIIIITGFEFVISQDYYYNVISSYLFDFRCFSV